MPIEILMPALSPTMTEGNLAKWLKKEGDKVEPGDVIAEIETDKATMEVEAVEEGIMGKILVSEGTENVKVNQPIALLLEEGEDKSVLKDYKPKQAEVESAPDSVKEQSQKEEPSAQEIPTAETVFPTKQVTEQSISKANIPTTPSIVLDGKIKASPLAKRTAKEKGVDLANIAGSGPHGRIIKADVLKAQTSSGKGQIIRHPVEYATIANDNMRKTIAKRLLQSKQYIPHFYLSIDCNIDKLLAARKELNDEAISSAARDSEPAYKLSVNDMVIKAVALALKKVPDANASWTDEAILKYNNIDISVAVAIKGGLITPIVRNADQKTIFAISAEMKLLAQKARENSLKPEEFQGGGFSISNLGMYNIKSFSAIINPPQSCILAVGAGEKKPVVNEITGKIEVATIMNVVLSCDHRVVDGAIGAQFLDSFKNYIQKPSLLLI